MSLFAPLLEFNRSVKRVEILADRFGHIIFDMRRIWNTGGASGFAGYASMTSFPFHRGKPSALPLPENAAKGFSQSLHCITHL